MDFDLTDDQRALREEALRFSRSVLARRPRGDGLDRGGWEALAEFGVMAMPLPEEHGGTGAGVLSTVLVLEALALGGADLGLLLSAAVSPILFGIPLSVAGTPEQKGRHLPGIAAGTSIGGFALTEPDSGSDAAALRTRARREGEEYVLDGSKMFVTNGPVGDVFLVMAVTAPEKGREGISAFLVERDTPGLSIGQPLDKMGHRGSPTSEVVLDGCRVPAENMVGSEGEGFTRVARLGLEWERCCLLASGIGSMALQLERSARYASERRQFDQPVGAFPAVREKLARMAALVEASRGMLFRAAWLKDQGRSAVLETSVAKLYTSEASLYVADQAIQIHGGYGYIREYPVEASWRDHKLFTIGGGTSEIQLKIIGDILRKRQAQGRCPVWTLP